jgi:hypothetical protein
MIRRRIMDKLRCTRCNDYLSLCGSWTTDDRGTVIETKPTLKCLHSQLVNCQQELEAVRRVIKAAKEKKPLTTASSWIVL